MHLILSIDKLLYNNIHQLCPPLAQILINTYQYPVHLIIPGSGGLMSTEVTMQGDPLAIVMYALAVTPLIHHLYSSDRTFSQVWYANDASRVGKCAALQKWWDTLTQLRPLFSYTPNDSKLTVPCSERQVCKCVFSDMGIVISTDEIWVLQSVTEIILQLMSLLRFTLGAVRFNAWQSLQTYFLVWSLVLPDGYYSGFIAAPGGGYSSVFVPALFGHPPCLPIERDLYGLLVHLGSFGLMNLCSAAHSCFHGSNRLTVPLATLIAAQCTTQTTDCDHIHQLKQSIRKNNCDH